MMDGTTVDFDLRQNDSGEASTASDNDTVIAAVADLLAKSNLDGRAAFMEQLDAAIRRYGVCVAV